MTNNADDWSPADAPHAIALSEAQWWRDAAQLAISRMRRNDDPAFRGTAQQIDARQLVFALRQLLSAAKLAQGVLEEQGADPAAFKQARDRFEKALPGIKHMRDGLMHFEEWARGKGRGPQQTRRHKAGLPRDIARDFWDFGFDPAEGTVSLGPYRINIDVAECSARKLCWAICLAACEVDEKITD